MSACMADSLASIPLAALACSLDLLLSDFARFPTAQHSTFAKRRFTE
jgi:hypothetical protein